MKKTIIFILCAAIVMALLPVVPITVGAADASDMVTYEISGEKAYVSGCDTSATGSVIIKSEYNGYPVTKIVTNAFSGCSGIASITIPDGVTSIGESAFNGCTDLTSIEIPVGVTSISYGTLYNCTGLKSITIPDGVMSIGGMAFSGCTGLMSITVPDSVTSIGGGAFSGCTGLTSITISDGVTSIGAQAFYRCKGLKSVILPDSVTDIGENAFAFCSRLQNIVLPKNLKSIQERTFEECSSLSKIIIPNGVSSVGDFAFWNCVNLTSVTLLEGITSIGLCAFNRCISLSNITIPEGVTSIGSYAFAGCKLTSIEIPESVNSLGERCFENCRSLQIIKVSRGNKKYHSSGNCIIDTENKTLVTALYDCVIPNDGSVKVIGEYAFQGGVYVSSLIIPEGIETIEMYSLCDNTYYTDKLKYISLPKSVSLIDYRAFKNASITIKCYTNSYAHKFAIEENIPYILLDEVELGIAALTGASVDVDSTLTLNCFAKPDEGMTDATKLRVKFTRNGKSVWAGGVLRDDGKYRFAYEGITPQCMADIISIELYYGENKIDEKKYSIKEYCDTIAASSTTSLNISAQQFAKLKTMLADMLTYGSKAQVFANYNTSTLADSSEWVSKWVSQYVKPENIKSLSGSGDGARIGGAGLILENTVKIYYNITTDDAENVTAVLKRNGVTVLEKKVSQLDKANGVYRFVSNGISARNFNDKFELELYKNGDMVHSYTYSVNSYIAVMDGNAAVGELIKALGSYGKSALDYVNG